MSYTYFHVNTGLPPYRKTIKRTRGKFWGITKPTGPFKFRYAVFDNRASRLYIPLHDLTPETKAAIGA